MPDALDPLDHARQELRHAADELAALQRRLRELRAGVPPSPQEVSTEDFVGEFDAANEVRTVLAGVIESLGTHARDLRAAADYRPGG